MAMMRSGLVVAVLAASLGMACSGSEGDSPTAPSSTSSGGSTSGAGPQTPTQQSCVPSAPNNLRVNVNGSSRVFTWDAVNGAQDYFIQIGSGSGGSDLVNTNTSQTTYSWTGAGPGTYYARVYARNSCGSGPNSTQISFN
jgi:hypothetical protein